MGGVIKGGDMRGEGLALHPPSLPDRLPLLPDCFQTRVQSSGLPAIGSSLRGGASGGWGVRGQRNWG